eukprot:NODE_492_length_6837_cov_0.395963.p7 type:complete len:150 gc:universal NODE_492_length_6837_cov_0.395963:2541-2990(+)
MTDSDLQQLLDGVLDEFESTNTNTTTKNEQSSQKSISNIIDESTTKMNDDPLLDELSEMFANEQLADGLEDLMKHLLTKDMLYEPLEALKEKYTDLNDDKYKEQLRLVKEMLHAFDHGQDDKIPKLIEEMQQHEMPPEFNDFSDGCPMQ